MKMCDECGDKLHGAFELRGHKAIHKIGKDYHETQAKDHKLAGNYPKKDSIKIPMP